MSYGLFSKTQRGPANTNAELLPKHLVEQFDLIFRPELTSQQNLEIEGLNAAIDEAEHHRSRDQCLERQIEGCF